MISPMAINIPTDQSLFYYSISEKKIFKGIFSKLHQLHDAINKDLY